MGTPVTLNATTYEIPALGEDNWGEDVTNYLIALSTGVLSKAGGTFTLTAEVDFGTGFGLKSIYYKSRGTVSTAGVVRLANDEALGWRNAANSADLQLKVNSSNILEFGGNPIPTIALGGADTVLQMNGAGTAYEFALINNANIAAAASIAVNKLAALTASRAVATDGDGFLAASSVTATELGYVSGVTSAIQTQLDAKFLSSNVIDEDDMSSNLDTKVPTQQSVKAYVDSRIASVNEADEITYSNATSGLTATDVQAAIDEVEGRLQTAEGDISTVEGDLATHLADTTAHGTTGNVVGTSDTQVLTNKDIDGGTASNSSRITLPKNTTSNLDGLTDKEATIAYDTDLDVPVYNTGAGWVALATAASSLDSSSDYKNGSLAASVGSSALTIALKDKGGSDPSGSSPVSIAFRNATATTGTYNVRSVTSSLSVTVSSGSTLGHSSGIADYIYVYLIDNSGTPELAVSSNRFDDGTILSTTAEGGAGAADSKSVIYSTTARSNVPVRLIGRMLSTQTTAGTWAAVPTEISNIPFRFPSRKQVIFSTSNIQNLSGTSSGTIATFNNAVVGRWYLVHLTLRAALTTSGVSNAYAQILNNSVVFGEVRHAKDGTDAVTYSGGITALFRAQATTITVTGTAQNATIAGTTSGTLDGSYAIISEVDPSDITTAFT